MKKLQTTILITFLAFATALVSCKKDEPADTNRDLLVGKKWYYQSLTVAGGAAQPIIYLNFDVTDYWLFKADGTYEETWDFDNGTYTLSSDKKTINIRVGTYNQDFSITKINSSELEFNFTDGSNNNNNNFAFVLSTTPKP
jgi:hypothetical protein